MELEGNHLAALEIAAEVLLGADHPLGYGVDPLEMARVG